SPNLPVDLEISIKKHPSPSINPANQLGSGINTFAARGLSAGIIPGKESLSLSDKPLFIDALIATILEISAKVNLPSLIILIADLNKTKSEYFFDNKG